MYNAMINTELVEELATIQNQIGINLFVNIPHSNIFTIFSDPVPTRFGTELFYFLLSR